MKAINEDQYRQQLKDNMEILYNAVYGGAYPQLSALFLSYRKSLYNKLLAMLDYFIHYGEDERQRMSYYEGRGWEMMLSYDVMTTLGAGKDKATWEKTILKLCALQMLGMFRPRTDEYSLYNSSVQQLSAERAEVAGRKPVTWYRVPAYTDRLLKIAESKAPAVKAMGSGINKDAIRDAWGVDQANRVTDTGYPLHDETEIRRKAIKEVLVERLQNRGYTRRWEVLFFARYKMGNTVGWQPIDVNRWEQAWSAYKPLLFSELHLKEGRPTKAEKERWALEDDSWIIRQR